MQQFGDLNVYVSGEGKKVIVVITDIFGPESGRHKAVVDYYASLGYYVLCPDFFYGKAFADMTFATFDDWCKEFSRSRLVADFKKNLAPALAGCSVGFAGFCYGSWIGLALTHEADLAPLIKCGVNFHPSFNLENRILGNDPVAFGKAATSPQLLLPAENDPVYMKEGGEVVVALQAGAATKGSAAVNFEKMTHGWVTRGDLSAEGVKDAVAAALDQGADFFQKFL